MRQEAVNVTENECIRFLMHHVIRGGKPLEPIRDNLPRWMGHKILKFPEDLILYQQVLYKNKPDILVEIGTKFGGSALFFAHMFDLIGHGEVLSIDMVDFPKKPTHPRITYLIGESLFPEIIQEVKEKVQGKSCMVILDGFHDSMHVREELEAYKDFVTSGQYLVVEDVHDGRVGIIISFLNENKEFTKVDLTNQLVIHVTRDGWLKKS